jgi:hypothetical protein
LAGNSSDIGVSEERFDELDDRSAFDGFGTEIHAGENGRAGIGVNKKILLGATNRIFEALKNKKIDYQ